MRKGVERECGKVDGGSGGSGEGVEREWGGSGEGVGSKWGEGVGMEWGRE